MSRVLIGPVNPLQYTSSGRTEKKANESNQFATQDIPRITSNKRMEHCLKRSPIFVKEDESGDVSAKEYNKYKIQTRAEYEDLMMEFEFQCKRTSMMCLHEAAAYDKNIYRMEIAAAFLGTVSVSGIAAWFVQGDATTLTSFNKFGTLGALGVTCASFMYFLGRGSSRLMPSMSHREETYISAGAAWQRVAQKTRSCRIRLDNPCMDVPDYAKWYDELIEEREKLCAMASIPQSTMEKYDNPKLVYTILRQRRQMFLQYLQLETTDVDDFIQNNNYSKTK